MLIGFGFVSPEAGLGRTWRIQQYAIKPLGRFAPHAGAIGMIQIHTTDLLMFQVGFEFEKPLLGSFHGGDSTVVFHHAGHLQGFAAGGSA